MSVESSLSGGGGAESWAEEDEEFVRVLTLNFKVLPPFDPIVLNEYKEERVNYFAEFILEKYDVVAIQEIFEPFGTKLIEIARGKGFPYASRGEFQPGYFRKVAGDGLLILSRHPILKDQNFLYDDHVEKIVSFQSRRPGALYSCIQFGEGRGRSGTAGSSPGASNTAVPPKRHLLHLICTHLQSGNNASAIQAREREVVQLRGFVTQIREKDDKHPILVVGDLNVNSRVSPDDSSDSKEYKMMMDILSGDYVPLPTPTKKLCYVDNVTDILAACHHGHHPVTLGDIFLENGRPIAGETVLTGLHDRKTRQSLDYMILLRPKLSPWQKQQIERERIRLARDDGEASEEWDRLRNQRLTEGPEAKEARKNRRRDRRRRRRDNGRSWGMTTLNVGRTNLPVASGTEDEVAAPSRNRPAEVGAVEEDEERAPSVSHSEEDLNVCVEDFVNEAGAKSPRSPRDPNSIAGDESEEFDEDDDDGPLEVGGSDSECREGSGLLSVAGDCQVEKFLVQGQRFSQMSDHYGVSVSFFMID
eukprot:TRINITY_DN14859_c0_g1_i1.p1 TRINITY_DN14859_c0_g1~~TRINITY_DN14859_c0_g1_i1.p1  ORF type:complete len:531 (+),score=96.22 TRINITY_DN14859_c0_g1_i1:142-1734(+)